MQCLRPARMVFYPLQYFGLMNGIGVTTAFLNLFLTSISTSVPFLCHPFSTYPMAMFFSKVGDGIPDVTLPTKSLDEGLKIFAPSVIDHRSQSAQNTATGRDLRRAGAPSTINPTLRRGGPSFKCFNTKSAPMNPPVSRLCLPITQLRPASTGEVSSSRS